MAEGKTFSSSQLVGEEVNKGAARRDFRYVAPENQLDVLGPSAGLVWLQLVSKPTLACVDCIRTLISGLLLKAWRLTP